jgi:hypothetical protein
MEIKEIYTVVGECEGRRIAVQVEQFLFHQLCTSRKIESNTSCTVDFVADEVLIVYSACVDTIVPGDKQFLELTD